MIRNIFICIERKETYTQRRRPAIKVRIVGQIGEGTKCIWILWQSLSLSPPLIDGPSCGERDMSLCWIPLNKGECMFVVEWIALKIVSNITYQLLDLKL